MSSDLQWIMSIPDARAKSAREKAIEKIESLSRERYRKICENNRLHLGGQR